MNATSRAARAGAIMLAGSLALTSCAAPPGGTAAADSSSLTPQERSLQQASNKFATTQTEGAIAGALFGAVLGYAVGGARGAAIGGVSGLAAGALAGTLVAQNNYAQAQTETNYAAAINDAQQARQEFAQYAQTAQDIANSTNARVAELQSQLRSNAITSDQYAVKIGAMKADIGALQKMSNGAQKRLELMQKNAQLAKGADHGQFAEAANSVEQSKARIDGATQTIRQAIDSAPT